MSLCFIYFQRLYQNRSPVMDDISNNFNRVPYRCQIWLGDCNKAISQVSLVIHLLPLYVRHTYCNGWKLVCSWHTYCYVYVFLLLCVCYSYCYVHVFLLTSMLCSVYSLPTGILRLPWLRFFRAFSSVVRQMPGYTSQRRGTVRTLPN